MIRVLLHRSANMQRYMFLLIYRSAAVFETTVGIFLDCQWDYERRV